MTGPCERELEVLEFVTAGIWPAKADAELRAHVDGCSECRELVSVVFALSTSGGDQRAQDSRHRLPDARLVWHRAQMQARCDSARSAARPVLFAQIAAAAIGVFVLLLWSDSTGLLGRMTATLGPLTSAFVDSAAAVRDAFQPATGSISAADATRLPLGYFIVGSLGLVLIVFAAAAGVSRLVDRSDEA